MKIDSLHWATPEQPRQVWGTWWPRLALAAIVAVAAALRLVNLGALGYANHYYTAGIVSMLQSWRNFFFAAAEPGGAVSIDKPPVGLWLQAVSAHFWGINGFAMVLPESLCGLLSMVVLYHLVRRWFGAAAGLAAALALALTPIGVATDRNNTIDSSLIFTLLLAAWAFIRAAESGRLRWLLLGAGLVGVGFNIKMLQAFLPLPAFYALYVFGAPRPLRRKLAHLALATALLLAVSLSWAVAVDLTPASARPYVGSSGNNSELNLALGYNGLERLTGMGSSLAGFWQRLTSGNAGRGAGPVDGNRPPAGQAPGGAGNTPPLGPAQAAPPFAPGGNFPAGPGGLGGPGGGIGGPVGGGPMNMGQPGPLRLFTSPLSKEVSWLLPFGLFSLALLLLSARPQWPVTARPHQAAVLWGGWLVTGGVFFSVAGFFHEYYLSMLAAPLAALVGIGLVGLWRLYTRRPWLSLCLLLAAATVTIVLQALTAATYAQDVTWLAGPVILLGLGAVLLTLTAGDRQRLAGLAGMAGVASAMLFIPGVWSALTALNSSANQSLPAAYSGRASSGPANGGGLQVNQALLAYLQANTQTTQYLMAVPSAMQGADYVIATGRPVLYLGGFNGQDQVLNASSLSALVKGGKLRYIYNEAQGGPGRNGGAQAELSAWVAANCQAVQGFETTTRNAGAPDGTTGAPDGTAGATGGAASQTQDGAALGGRGGGGFGPGGNLAVALYDCGKP